MAAVDDSDAPKTPCFMFIMLSGDRRMSSAYVPVSEFAADEQAFLRQESSQREIGKWAYTHPASPLYEYGKRLGFTHPRKAECTHIDPKDAAIVGVIVGRYFC